MEATSKFTCGDNVSAPVIGIKGKIEATEVVEGKVFHFVRISPRQKAWLSETNIVKG